MENISKISKKVIFKNDIWKIDNETDHEPSNVKILKPIKFSNNINEIKTRIKIYLILKGHTSSIRSVAVRSDKK